MLKRKIYESKCNPVFTWYVLLFIYWAYSGQLQTKAGQQPVGKGQDLNLSHGVRSRTWISIVTKRQFKRYWRICIRYILFMADDIIIDEDSSIKNKIVHFLWFYWYNDVRNYPKLFRCYFTFSSMVQKHKVQWVELSNKNLKNQPWAWTKEIKTLV